MSPDRVIDRWIYERPKGYYWGIRGYFSYDLIDYGGREKSCNPYVPDTEFPVTFSALREMRNVYFAGVLVRISWERVERIPNSMFCIAYRDGHYVNVPVDATVPPTGPYIYDVRYPDDIALFSGPAGTRIPCIFSFPAEDFAVDMVFMQTAGLKPDYERDFILGDWVAKFAKIEVTSPTPCREGWILETTIDWINRGVTANRIVVVVLGHYRQGWTSPYLPWVNFEPVEMLSGVWFGKDGEIVRSITHIPTGPRLADTWDIFAVLGNYTIDPVSRTPIISAVLDVKCLANAVTIS